MLVRKPTIKAEEVDFDSKEEAMAAIQAGHVKFETVHAKTAKDILGSMGLVGAEAHPDDVGSREE